MAILVDVKGQGKVEFPDGTPKETMLQALRRRFGNVAKGNLGTLEAIGTMATGAIAEPLSGLAGIAGAVLPGKSGQGAEWVQATQDALTYQPRTQAGQERLQSVGEFLQPVGEVMQKASQNLGDKAYSATGSPALAAAAYSVPTAIAEGVGLKGVNILRKPVSKSDLYTPRIFAGVNAKTADLTALNKAKQLEAQGVNEEQIWQETGWFNDRGDWKFEIDDSTATMSPSVVSDTINTSVGDALNHKALFEAYPMLASIRLMNNPNMPRDALGRFADDLIEINKPNPSELLQNFEVISQLENSLKQKLDPNSENFWMKRAERDFADGDYDSLDEAIEANKNWMQWDKDELDSLRARYWNNDNLSTVLHEMQHAVQGVEGHATGGDVGMATAAGGSVVKADPRYSSGSQSDWDSLMKEYEWLKSLQPVDKYMRLGGEVEARLMERRIGSSEAQRRASFPLKALDVPREQVIPYKKPKS